MVVKGVCFLFLFLFCLTGVLAQDEYADRKFQFISYEKIPTWTGVATAWDSPQPVIHLYNPAKYRGHADFVSQGLKTGITFKQFKEQVQHFSSRRYLPFFLFDARAHPLQVNGKTYTWALMLEDYAYYDTQAQMAETVLRLMNFVKAYIGRSVKAPTENNGLVILTTNLKAQPNIGIAEKMEKAGYPHKTISELNTLFDAPKLMVLNSGTAYGYLRYIGSKDKTPVNLSPQDIVVYEKIPARVPPVSGIITLEPQTPLSHINLLAKNRNTINLYVQNMQQVPGLENLRDKLVKIECSGKKIMVSAANENEAKKFWTQRIAKINIPQPVLHHKEIVDLSSTQKEKISVEYTGAKAANYALIQQRFGNYVRPGFAVPFYWYHKTIQDCGADTLIENFLQEKTKLSAASKKEKLEKIQECILKAKADTALIHALVKCTGTHFNHKRIRLRSSTNCEDLPEFNGAGLYVSKGYNTTDSLSKLEKKILQVYASLWSQTAFDEREFYFIDHKSASMAILINEAFTHEVANGVLLTIPQKTGYSIFINTQSGGDLVTNPVEGQIPESILFKGAGDASYLVESKSNVKDIFLSDKYKTQLDELKDLAMKIQYLFGEKKQDTGQRKFGVDLEFRIMEENGKYRLYVKQARLLGQTLPE